MNCRMNTMSSAVTIRPRYLHSTTAICPVWQKSKPERKADGGGDFLCAHAPPYRRGFGFRIAGRQQQLRLMRAQCSARFRACRPPFETALRQALCGHPKPLAVIGQDPDRLPLRLRKMNRQPENGSEFSFSRHSCARESMPFLPSMASIATRMRSCGVI